MRPIVQIDSPADIQVVYAESDLRVATPMIAGLQRLIGFPSENIHHFVEIDEAADHIEAERTKPTVAIFGDHTPVSGWSGAGLSRYLLEKADQLPHLQMVTLIADDPRLVDYATVKEGGIQMGCEAWDKKKEEYLMLAWIGESLRNGEVASKQGWVRDNDILPPHNERIFALCYSLRRYDTDEEASRFLNLIGLGVGDFFNLPTAEVMNQLRSPTFMVEGRPHIER